ncbi:hypothetical protein SAMN05421807_1021, partial [Virgibacillus chiguensis]
MYTSKDFAINLAGALLVVLGIILVLF